MRVFRRHAIAQRRVVARAGDTPLTLNAAHVDLYFFLLVFALTTLLTFYTMAKSRRLSDFLDALSDENLSPWAKFKSLAAVWRRSHE